MTGTNQTAKGKQFDAEKLNISEKLIYNIQSCKS